MTTDTTAPLIFKGILCLAVAGSGSYTDVSDELTAAKIRFAVDEIDIPATAGQPGSTRGGGVMAFLDVGFLSTDGSGGTLYPMLYAAAATATGELDFILRYRDGAKGATNPQWCGTVIVTGGALGGDAETLSADSQSFPMTDLPVLDEA
jgi:hypothetical protein